MSMGGKTSKSTQEIKLDPRIETAAAEAAAAGLRAAALPYRANRGVSIAALSPQQKAAFEGADAAAAAFGLPSVGGGVPGAPVTSDYVPDPTTTSEGFKGYSTSKLLDENIAASTDEEYRNVVAELLRSYASAADKVSPAPEGLTDSIQRLEPFASGNGNDTDLRVKKPKTKAPASKTTSKGASNEDSFQRKQMLKYGWR